jgi:putative FmdB family regulatory protein
MPIYEYQCSECGLYFERLQRFGAPSPETCPNGHKQVQRLLSQPTIIFKGSGFYVTDNGRSSRVGASQNGQPSKNGKPATSAEPAEKTSPKTEEKPKS